MTVLGHSNWHWFQRGSVCRAEGEAATGPEWLQCHMQRVMRDVSHVFCKQSLVGSCIILSVRGTRGSGWQIAAAGASMLRWIRHRLSTCCIERGMQEATCTSKSAAVTLLQSFARTATAKGTNAELSVHFATVMPEAAMLQRRA